MSARDRILAKLKAAPNLPKPEPDVAAWFAGHRPVENTAEKVARFRKHIEFAHAEFHAVTPATWLAKLREVLAARQISRELGLDILRSAPAPR